MGSCNTKQEVVSQTSATGTPVANVLKSKGTPRNPKTPKNPKGSKVHATSDSAKKQHPDTVSEDLKFFVTVSDDNAKNGDATQNGNSVENSVEDSKDLKQSGVQKESLGPPKSGKRGERRRNRQIAKAMRIGEFAVIVEIKDQGMCSFCFLFRFFFQRCLNPIISC